MIPAFAVAAARGSQALLRGCSARVTLIDVGKELRIVGAGGFLASCSKNAWRANPCCSVGSWCQPVRNKLLGDAQFTSENAGRPYSARAQACRSRMSFSTGSNPRSGFAVPVKATLSQDSKTLTATYLHKISLETYRTSSVSAKSGEVHLQNEHAPLRP